MCMQSFDTQMCFGNVVQILLQLFVLGQIDLHWFPCNMPKSKQPQQNGKESENLY